MGAGQQFARRMILVLAATMMVLATGVVAHSQESSSSPKPFAGFGQFDAPPLPPIRSANPGQDNNSTPWMTMPRDLSPRRSVSDSKGEATASGDQFRFGNGYIGFQMQKSLQTPDQVRRSDCAKDEDCTDYPGAPKFSNPKTTVKSLKKPFIGLSITAPLHE
jgi:hypothetical protein